jgi:hypothetical protein
LIALRPASVVVVVGNHVLSLILKATKLTLKPTILTPLLMVPAHTVLPRPHQLVLQPSPRLQLTQLLLSKLPLTNSPSLSQLLPPPSTSNHTQVVFLQMLPPAVPLLITPSLQLVMVN